MNPLFATTLKQWKSDGLAPVFPHDLDALIELHAAADAVTHAKPSAEYQALLEPCVCVGNVTLRRPSLGVVEFISHRLPEWCPHEDDQLRGLLWCMAHGDRPEKLWKLSSPLLFRARVRMWCRRVRATLPAIAEALASFQREEQKASTGPTKRSDFGWMVDVLMAEYGGTPERWIWRESLDTVNLLLTNCAMRKAAESGKAHHDPDAPGMRELRAYRTAEHALGAILRQRKAAARG